MKTADEVAAAFRADLQALLDKYGAELDAKDCYVGYSECGSDIRMIVTIPAIYGDDHCGPLSEWTEIDLGDSMRAEDGK